MSRWTRALITGASSGIGEAFARKLASEGTDLVIVARREPLLQQLASQLQGIDVEVLRADLADDADVARVAQRLQQSDKPIDLLINNAGLSLFGGFQANSLEQHRHLVAVCALAPMTLMHAALQAMVERGRGNVINISSVCGSGPVGSLGSYSASKGFLNNLSQSAALDLAAAGHDDVVVTTVVPGPVKTPINEVAGTPVNMSGWIEPDDFVPMVLDAAAAGKRLCVPERKNQLRNLLTPRYPYSTPGRFLAAGFATARAPYKLVRRLARPPR